MRLLLWTLGAGFLGLAVWLGYTAFAAIDDLQDSGLLSFKIWTNAFWLADTQNYKAGLGENAKWFLRLFGGFWALLFGWRFAAAAGHMAERDQ